MDYLLQEDISKDDSLILIDLFINDIRSNRIGMEPYPISLRAVNWIKFLSLLPVGYLKEYNGPSMITKINDSLCYQYQILEKNLEYHILGNHLLENGISLLFGAFYFREYKLWSTAVKLIAHELNEQILQDGAHFELSPMYHQILTDRLLDCINLLQNNKVFENQGSLYDLLVHKASLMVRWLEKITFSSGDIPLFNDSAFNISPSTIDILKYACRLGIMEKISDMEFEFSDSGYRKYSDGKYELIFDIGPTGPNYQPGHAHADTFTFELQIDGSPAIVDTGTSTYNKGERRLLERGSVSHNITTINDKNSSDVWSGHRIGRRANVIVENDDPRTLSCSHTGYDHMGYRVYRTLFTEPERIIIVDKTIPNRNKLRSKYLNKETRATARLHIHPDRTLVENGQTITVDGKTDIVFHGNSKIRIKDFWYAPQFNQLVKSKVIEVEFEDELRTIISIRDA